MRLRPYIPLKDYEYIQNWINDERVHALWCANLIPYPMTLKESRPNENDGAGMQMWLY